MLIIGWLFLIASWIVPQWAYPMPNESRKKFLLGIWLSAASLVCFILSFFTHVHGSGCNH